MCVCVCVCVLICAFIGRRPRKKCWDKALDAKTGILIIVLPKFNWTLLKQKILQEGKLMENLMRT